MTATLELDRALQHERERDLDADARTAHDIDRDIDHDIDRDIDHDIDAAGQTVTPTPLATKARCADGHGTLTHLFFSDIPLDIARAKAICAKCTMAAACLEAAVERHEPWGVWGGELLESGKVVVNKRPRGRPPKNPRPELVVDEVPIPPHLVA